MFWGCRVLRSGSYIETYKKIRHMKTIKTIKCTNQHCDDGIVGVVFGEEQLCGVCDGEGVIDLDEEISIICLGCSQTWCECE
jgi:hypothetical protein